MVPEQEIVMCMFSYVAICYSYVATTTGTYMAKQLYLQLKYIGSFYIVYHHTYCKGNVGSVWCDMQEHIFPHMFSCIAF